MIGVRGPRVKQEREPKLKKGPRESLWLRGLNKDGKPRLFELKIPSGILATNLPMTARRVCYSRSSGFVGAIVGALLLVAISFGGVLFNVPVLFITFAALFAGGWGAAIGWVVGRLFKRKPYWMASYEWEDKKRVLTPYEHSQIGREAVELVYPDQKADPEAEAQVMGVWRATTWYETEQMRDEKEDLRAGLDTWQKVEAGALALIACALLVFLFFFIAAFQESDAAPAFDGESHGTAVELSR